MPYKHEREGSLPFPTTNGSIFQWIRKWSFYLHNTGSSPVGTTNTSFVWVKLKQKGSIAQLVRAPVLHAGGSKC